MIDQKTVCNCAHKERNFLNYKAYIQELAKFSKFNQVSNQEVRCSINFLNG